MNSSKPTLAIYGIQDRQNNDYPGYVHDHNMVLMRDGRVEKLLQLERLTRKKRDNKLYSQLTELLRSEKLIQPGTYDIVFVDNVVGRAFIGSDGQTRFEAPLTNQLATQPEKGRCWWFDSEVDAWVLNHELAHIGSCLPFFGSFKENSLLVHFDGGASLTNFSAWHYKNNTLIPIEHHWDLKYLTSLFNANGLVFALLGAKRFDQNSVPGKMMGYASFGQYDKRLEDWLVENEFFTDLWGKRNSFFEKARKDWQWKEGSLNLKDPFLQNIVATMQGIFQRDFLAKMEQLQQQTRATSLYYSGGCALNIVTNSALIEANTFQEVFIPPCCEDSGLALGAAAFVEWLKHDKIELHHPYLNNWGLPEEPTIIDDAELTKTAEAIADGKVIGICNGAGESGPRALGNRSIIARADDKTLAKKVSMHHKGREWYRPVAPVMLERNACYFTRKGKINPLAKYMLLDFYIPQERRNELQGAIHVDNTARIQTLTDADENPWLFRLLTLLDERYGLRALINTSFNHKGEPIVHTTEDAKRSAQNMQLDGVVLNGQFIILNES